ncbi:MAG: hypothetical protein Q8Q09_04650 [Deltaproteobacteria bacterium]|nr:hypothetical protein [Deltaproteobacteria bacterium]
MTKPTPPMPHCRRCGRSFRTWFNHGGDWYEDSEGQVHLGADGGGSCDPRYDPFIALTVQGTPTECLRCNLAQQIP